MKATHTLRRLALGMVVPVNAPQSLSVRASPQLYPLLFGSRCVATQGISADCDLKCAFAEAIPSLQERLKNIKTSFGSKSLGEVTVNMALGGMRGVPGLLWETSLLDAEDGIRFRGHTITELKQKLPKATPSGEPLPEGLLWLLLTGNVPSKQQAVSLSAELQKRAETPPQVFKVLDALPAKTHPMTQLSCAIMAMQPDSKFALAYQNGLHKSDYWDPTFEDSLDCIARLPGIAAAIYRRTFRNGSIIEADPSLDWAGNLAHMMGYQDQGAKELMRLYMTIHSDHEEVLKWLNRVESDIGSDVSKEELSRYVSATLNSGRVVPGYGHAVLRKTDPRFTCQREFGLKHLPDYPKFKLVSKLFEVVPGVLAETGKVSNPWPNVDAHSGVLLQFYGITEENFYTVLFGVSRAMGVLSQLVLSRAMGLPIERPKSMTTRWLENKFGQAGE